MYLKELRKNIKKKDYKKKWLVTLISCAIQTKIYILYYEWNLKLPKYYCVYIGQFVSMPYLLHKILTLNI